MIHDMCGKVTLDLWMPQSSQGHEGNQITFQDGALECQLKQRKHDIHFFFYHALYKEPKDSFGSLVV
jgi:hypothetical protein